MLRTVSWLWTYFRIPLFVLLGIVIYGLLVLLHLTLYGTVVALLSIALGSYGLFIDTFNSLTRHQFALDYIAILAIIVSVITGEYLVGTVIALMIASGETLEEYGVSSAKDSLSKLVSRLPRQVLLFANGKTTTTALIEEVKIGQKIFIRKGEVIPLDGVLVSQEGVVDESSLTGEPYPVEKISGDPLRSGTVNIGDPMAMEVIHESKDSTYRKIIEMVQKAQGEKAPLIRLADRYSTYFTLTTFIIAAVAFWHYPHLESVLAVLVVATPCPLIIATPIALLGGVNAAAKKRIIVKKLASLESLSRTNAIILDKTGTVTLGKPRVVDFKIYDKKYSPKDLLSVAEAIERNSLHPLAKAVVRYANDNKAKILHAARVSEKVGSGILGIVNGKKYTLSKIEGSGGMNIGLFEKEKLLAVFTFADEIKDDSKEILKELKDNNIVVSMYTGDKQKAAEEVVKQMGIDMEIHASSTPQDKQKGIQALQKMGKVTAMVGDGINDAPALALADVGMVFSNEEQTAATDAADVVFLGGNFALVLEAQSIAKKTIGIAMQSILWGIGMSVGAMILAAFGLIPPLYGAILQEGIDVVVILNALRATRV